MVLHETDKGRAQRNEPSGLPETIFGQTICLNYCPHPHMRFQVFLKIGAKISSERLQRKASHPARRIVRPRQEPSGASKPLSSVRIL